MGADRTFFLTAFDRNDWNKQILRMNNQHKIIKLAEIFAPHLLVLLLYINHSHTSLMLLGFKTVKCCAILGITMISGITTINVTIQQESIGNKSYMSDSFKRTRYSL